MFRPLPKGEVGEEEREKVRENGREGRSGRMRETEREKERMRYF